MIAAAISVADYPASNERQTVALPFPYLVYRGPILRSDDKGLLRGRLFYSPRAEVDVSLSGSIPVQSGNAARRGMPDLDWIGEIGPRLELQVARVGDDASVRFELPVRAVGMTDFSQRFEYVGILAAPEISYVDADVDGRGTRVRVGLAALFADRGTQSLYFGVDAPYATAERPEYHAKAGYLGSRLLVSASHRLGDRARIVGAAGAYYYGGTANRESPLFLRELNTFASVGLIWSFWVSPTRVEE